MENRKAIMLQCPVNKNKVQEISYIEIDGNLFLNQRSKNFKTTLANLKESIFLKLVEKEGRLEIENVTKEVVTEFLSGPEPRIPIFGYKLNQYIWICMHSLRQYSTDGWGDVITSKVRLQLEPQLV